jgi:Carboxypeptidase regulatory-like domain
MHSKKLLLAGLLVLFAAFLVWLLWSKEPAAAGGDNATSRAPSAGVPAVSGHQAVTAIGPTSGPEGANRTEVVDPAAEPGFRVTGRVLQVANVPLTGAEVAAFRGEPDDRAGASRGIMSALDRNSLGGHKAFMATTGKAVARAQLAADGTFELATNCKDLRLQVEHDLYALHAYAVVHLSAARPSAHVVLQPFLGACLRGRVLGTGARAGIEVRLHAEPDPMSAMSDPQAYFSTIMLAGREAESTDAAGDFVFRGVVPGPQLLVTAHADDVTGRLATPPLQAGETREVAVALQPAATLTTTVVDAAQEPVDKASVAAEPLDVQGLITRRTAADNSRTDATGTCSLRGLQPGRYQVRAMRTGYVSSKQEIALQAGVQARLQLQLGEGGAVEGTVVDTEGHAVAGAHVTHAPKIEVPLLGDMTTSMGADLLFLSAAASPFRTDEKGHFRLTGIDDDGAFLVVAQRTADSAAAPPDGTPPAIGGGFANDVHAGDRDVKIVLLPPGGVVGRAEAAEDGKPITDFDVELSLSMFLGMTRPVVRQHFADRADGVFRLDDVNPGSYQLSVRAAGRSEVSQTVTCKQGRQLDVGAVQLPRGASVRGTVRDGAGVPVRSALVRVRRGGVLDSQVMAVLLGGGTMSRTDDRGAYELDDLLPGKLQLIASAQGFASERSERIEVASGQCLDKVDIVLGHGGTITGQVLLPLGEDGSDWLLVVKDLASQDGQRASLQSDGRFRVANLDPGPHEVQAMQPSVLRTMQQNTGMEPGQSRKLGEMIKSITDHTVSQRCTVRAGEEVEVTLDARDLGSGSELTLHVLVGDRPLQSGLVEITGADGSLHNGFLTDGTLRLGSLQPGHLRVQVRSGMTLTPLGGPVDLEYPAGATQHSETIRLPGGELEGRVVDAHTGAPLRDVLVRLLHDDAPETDDPIGFALTDALGVFRFSALGEGSYTLLAADLQGNVGEGAAGRVAGIRISGNDVVRGIELQARQAAGADVTVTGPAGQPVAGAMVACVDANGRPFGSLAISFCGQDGRAHLGGLPRGSARIVARAAGLAPAASDLLQLSPGEPVAFEVHLSSGTHVIVQVVGRDGRMLQGAAITARAGNGPWIPVAFLLERRNQDGSLDLGRLNAGPWEFRVSHPATGTFNTARTVGAAGTATLLLAPQ